jgi:hypothetical protein
MTNRYYRKHEIVSKKGEPEYYKAPSWTRERFDGIESREIVWEQGFRLDLIAEEVYKDPNMWRAIALFNGIGYPLALRPGMVISLPLKIKEVLDRI